MLVFEHSHDSVLTSTGSSIGTPSASMGMKEGGRVSSFFLDLSGLVMEEEGGEGPLGLGRFLLFSFKELVNLV